MRVKGGPSTRRYRKSIKKAASGSRLSRHTSYKVAYQTVTKSSRYAFKGRKLKKRTFRKLWIARINAAVSKYGYNYSTFIHNLKKNKIEINRKMLSELAIHNENEFKKIVESVCKKQA